MKYRKKEGLFPNGREHTDSTVRLFPMIAFVRINFVVLPGMFGLGMNCLAGLFSEMCEATISRHTEGQYVNNMWTVHVTDNL